MKLNLFKISKTDKNNFIKQIIESSTPDSDFYFLVILSTLIVALGLIGNNLILTIGGMLVAPLLSPLLVLALGVVIMNVRVTMRSIRIFFMSIFSVSIVSYTTGIIMEFDINQIDLIKAMIPSWYTFIVAVIAGLVASFAWARPDLSTTLPGVAITVTLIPPTAAIGLALASRNLDVFYNSIAVLLINIAGTVLASAVIFLFMGFYSAKRKIIAEVNEEERIANGDNIINKIINKVE